MKSKKDYYLNIHSRNINVKEKESGELEQGKSLTGHFYISLQAEEAKKFFGVYPEDNIVISNAKLETNKEKLLHEGIIEFSKKETDHVFTKQIRLTKEQYEKAKEYAETHTGKYVIGLADCADFVQSVYNAAGLPLYFTTAYSQEELSQIDSLAANKVSTVYGNRDNISIHLSSVSGVSREKVAAELNLPIEKVIPIPPDIDLDLHPTALPKFRILIDNADLIPLDNVAERTLDWDMSLLANRHINQQITQMVQTTSDLSAEEKEVLLNSVQQSNRDIESMSESFKEIKLQINSQMEKCFNDYFVEIEKPENKLKKFGFSQEEVTNNELKVFNIMANYQEFDYFFREIKERTDIKLTLSDIPEDINKFKSIIYNPEAIIDLYECGLIKQIQDLPQDQKVLDKVFEYEMGIVFMKENSVISNLEALYHKISDIEEISSFQKIASKSIEILESIGDTKKAMEIKLHLLISTIPEEGQTNHTKILDFVKNSGDIALLGYCQELLIQTENGSGDI